MHTERIERSATGRVIQQGIKDKAVGIGAVASDGVAFGHPGATGGGAEGRHEVVDGDGIIRVGVTDVAPAASPGEGAVAPATDAEIEIRLPVGGKDSEVDTIGIETDIAGFAVALLLWHHILGCRQVGGGLVPKAIAYRRFPVGISLVDVPIKGTGAVGCVQAELEAQLGEREEVSAGNHLVAELHPSFRVDLDNLLQVHGSAVGCL